MGKANVSCYVEENAVEEKNKPIKKITFPFSMPTKLVQYAVLVI